MRRLLWCVATLICLLWLLPAGVGAQTTCTETSVAVTGAVTGSPDLAGLVGDCTTLLGLKDTLRGTAILNWAEDLEMTSWDGITVSSGDPPRVTILNLPDKSLDGTIPSALGGLAALEFLYLNNNTLSDTIPAALGDLAALKDLYLNNNTLSGSIPAELENLSALQRLLLHHNTLSGAIPAALGNLTNLESLWLHNNALSGAIPDLSSLTKLTTLLLHDNVLGGAIPDLSSLTELTELSLHNNMLSGAISDLSALTKLTTLLLHDNVLSGTIPDLSSLTELTNLRLQNNILSGTIPDLSALTKLINLFLHNNALSGAIPATFRSLSALQWLYLNDNNLSGAIPAALGELSALQRLYLNHNNLSGAIPGALKSLSALQRLHLNDNNLSGAIPAALGELSDPTDLTSPAKLANLQRIYLHSNTLSGAVPSALGNLTTLRELNLHNNADLSGDLPTSFSSLTALRELHIQNTQVTVPDDTALQTWLAGLTVTTGTQKSLGTIALDAANAAPRGVWSDGTTLWVADADALRVFAYTLADNTRDAAKDMTLDATNTAPRGVWSNGTTLWVADADTLRVFAYTLADASRDAAKDIALDAANAAPRGVWSDETTLWVVDFDFWPFKVFAYTLADASRDAAKDIALDSSNDWQRGAWGDGTTLWVVDSNDARLYAYTLADGSHDAANYHILDPANTAPREITSDGTMLYVADANDAAVYIYGNRAPEALGTLPDQTLTVGGSAQTLTVTSAFRDLDGDALTYTAESSEVGVALATESGAEVTVQPVGVGTATITVTATDPDGLSVTQSFAVTVVSEPLSNQEPQAVGGLPEQMLTPEKVQTAPMTSLFRDPDGDALTYTATSSNPQIATVQIVSQDSGEDALRNSAKSLNTRTETETMSGAAIEVRPVAGGTVTITVTARDPTGSNQTATQRFTVTVDGLPPPLPPSRTSGTGSGSSGSGGGGSRDDHGNSPGRATRVRLESRAPWVSSTPGRLNTTRDVDYFRLTIPHDGVLVVETTGSTDTVGTVWQEGVELGMADSGGGRQNFRLSVPVGVGAVVIAVRGNGRRTGRYTLVTRLIVGYLENPGLHSFQSGLGVISGWACTAEAVTIEINGVPQAAAYGTARGDTAEVCGGTHTGFGVLFNWNLLGDGEHEVIALADGVEFARTTVTVTTLGAEFVRDVAGECMVADFPSIGESVRLVWQEAQQSFVLAEGSAPAGASRPGIAGVGVLENPSPNSFQSGIGVLSGWVCAAEEVTITLGDLAPQVAGYGTERLDTLDVCGDTANGFGLLFNWNLLGDGEHVVIATVDGTELARTTVRVTTLGEEFVRDVTGECTAADFPHPGATVTLTWQQNSQNFVITAVQ